MIALSYITDLLEQPKALQATLLGLNATAPLLSVSRRLASGKLHRLVLTGMGSSYFALHPLALRMIAQGYCVQMIETSELVHYAASLIAPDTLIVAVSQSGESAEIIPLLNQAEKKAFVIGVTNSAQGSLAQRADATILTSAGTEATVSCKTYLATLAALCWLGDQLAEGSPAQYFQLASGPQLVAEYLENLDNFVDRLEQRLKSIRHMFLIGRGESLAAVGVGGLIIKEAARFPAEGMSCAAFRHGPFELVTPEEYVLVFAGPEETMSLNTKLAAEIQFAGGQVDIVREGRTRDLFDLPVTTSALRPILEVLPVQMFTLALAALQGINPGEFSKASKVTAVE
jgi:glucosamine--fructose-6-phosphate aminotransferase (isomerizing)